MTDPNVVPIRELRFKPANSNDRARAGMEHDFKDVPQCSFAGDDGISPYIGADSTIGIYPDNPAAQAPAEGHVPDVAEDAGALAASLGSKLLRDGFALAVFVHAVAALAFYFVTIKLPDDAALLEGETVIVVEFFSETDSDVTTRVAQKQEDGEEVAIEEPKQEIVEAVKEPVKPVEQAKVPDLVKKPVETPVKVEEPVIGSDVPEVLATTQASDFQVEAAAKQILDDVTIQPLPDALPPMLVTPVEKAKPEPEKKLAQPVPHPVSKPRVMQKVAEVKPAEKPVEKKPEPKKEEPKKVEAKKPEPKTDKKEVKKKKIAQDGNADSNSTKGRRDAKRKDGNSQDASQGNSKKKLKGNASSTNYKGLVQKKLSRAKRGVTAGAKGNVVVGFTISSNGSMSNLHIKKSSGKPAVDRAALNVVRKASPFPAVPGDADQKTYNMSVPMTFK